MDVGDVPTEGVGGRRSYDPPIDPRVQIYVDERLTDTRHTLRNEITAIAATVTAGQLQSTKEHAMVEGRIEALHGEVSALRADFQDLKGLRDEVTQLVRHDVAGDARQAARDELLEKIDAGRKWMIATAIALAAVVIAATALILQHQP